MDTRLSNTKKRLLTAHIKELMEMPCWALVAAVLRDSPYISLANKQKLENLDTVAPLTVITIIQTSDRHLYHEFKQTMEDLEVLLFKL